jgi:alkanesulfonate monooxygenase SsuD/methylene tetrahydromethanopterin reductase-like flavin-dependent oxidoreductase (luciferase family)
MKRLWAGEDLDFKGRFWNVKGRMALTPVQKPGPPIEIAVHAEGAARRAARLAEGALLAPQIYIDDLKVLCAAYEDECSKVGRRGTLGVGRDIAFAKNRKEAEAMHQASLQHHIDRYSGWNMQEKGMVDIHITGANSSGDWAIMGSPEECVEKICQYKEELNLDFMGLWPADLPKGLSAQMEYMQKISEEVIAKVK